MKKNYELEYENLRKESETNKNYVFERPILILTVSLATINFGSTEYVPYIPIFITFLLCFNFLFTVNRLYSAARIIAYIMLVIETNHKPYHGWENLLVNHREFTTRLGNKRLRKIVKDVVINEKEQKVYGFYPLIYFFHFFIIVITYSSLFIKLEKIDLLVLVAIVIPFLFFVYLMVIYRISKIRNNLIQERTIMKMVLRYIVDKQILEELFIKYPDKYK